MGSSDDILRNPWDSAGGEEVSGWDSGQGIEGQIESGKAPDTKLPECGW